MRQPRNNTLDPSRYEQELLLFLSLLMLLSVPALHAQEIDQPRETRADTAVSTSDDEPQPAFVEFNTDPVVLLTPRELERLMRSIESDANLSAAVNQLLGEADEALAMLPTPRKVIVYEGHVSNDPERLKSAESLQDMNRLNVLTWSWLLTNNARHRDHATRILRSWAQKYEPTGNDVNENKLINCFVAFHHLKDHLSREDSDAIEAWLVSIVEAQMQGWSDHAAGSNRGAKRVKIVLLAAHAMGQPQWTEWALKRAQLCLDHALLADGRSRDLIHRDSMHYHVSSVENLIKIALMGRVMGYDFYRRTTEDGGSISKSIAYVRPYALGEKVYREWVNSKVELDRRRWKSGDP